MANSGQVINTDKAATYGHALSRLKREGKCPVDIEHRQIKYKNNVIECDHGVKANHQGHIRIQIYEDCLCHN
jgi:transposase-like protein